MKLQGRASARHLLQPRGYPRLLSIVIPVFNEEQCLPSLRERLTPLVNALPCAAEIVLVNDGSSDGSVDLLAGWAESDSRVKVFNLARNFGHQMAATAGLDQASGQAVVLMDADLQDPPEIILDMLEEYCRGYDVIYGRRISRAGETRFKRFSAWLFYRAMRLLVHSELPADVGDFRLVSRRCLDAVCSMRETHRFLRGMIAWVGFPQTAVPYARARRVAGKTAYPLRKMLWLAWTAAVSFSPTPLRTSFVLGFLIAAIGMLESANAIVRSILGLYVVPGWSSLIIVTCLIGGAILVSIGVLGEYIGRIFEAVKERPLYVIASQIGRHEPASLAARSQPDPVPSQLAAISHEN
ncbi:MAG: glycosyltransferase family 2 protein [Bryobacterales bacterium]|nr:glycosyltransferase family 2 protein [Bryobacterales bacterium]